MRDDSDHVPVTRHLHVRGRESDVERARITLTTAMLLMDDDWPSQLAHDLFREVLFQLTMLCGVEVTSRDEW